MNTKPTTADELPLRFTITRSTIVRIAGEVDDQAARALARVLDDLVDGHGVTDLIVDLSEGTNVPDAVVSLLDETRRRMESLGGLLELRAPREAVDAVKAIADDVPTFTPVPPKTQG